MTTEDDFQRRLRYSPQDWQTRLVYADWLQERGDPRADGYRALGVLRKWPHKCQGQRDDWYWLTRVSGQRGHPILPDDWFAVLSDGADVYWPEGHDKIPRREAEDAAALAFAKLPAARRRELLAANEVPTS